MLEFNLMWFYKLEVTTIIYTFSSQFIGDLTKFKENPIIIKEGVSYKLKIEFRVQREIVSGLRYFHTFHRKGIRGR